MAAPTADANAATQPMAIQPIATTAIAQQAIAHRPASTGAEASSRGSTAVESPGQTESSSTETSAVGQSTVGQSVGASQDTSTTSAGSANTAADDASTERTTTAIGNDTAWTPPSWDEVVRLHADRVYRLAFRLSGNKHDAEDLTQETFIRVFRSLASYKPGTFEGWLHRITTNLFLDLARRRSRLRMEGLPEDTDRLAGNGRSPEQIYHETHLDPDLQTALDELPPEFRAAVVLCDVEGLSYEEIGATLGVKLGTVRSRIHRGRQLLKAALETRREHAREDSE